jgi:flagellar hook-basal body complex protein FliE
MSVDEISIYNRLGKLISKELSPTESTDKVKPNKKSFDEILVDVLGDVDKFKKGSESKSADAALGVGGVAVHDAMIAMQKADVAFDIMNKVRSKIVRAYEEIMRTPV